MIPAHFPGLRPGLTESALQAEDGCFLSSGLPRPSPLTRPRRAASRLARRGPGRPGANSIAPRMPAELRGAVPHPGDVPRRETSGGIAGTIYTRGPDLQGAAGVAEATLDTTPRIGS